MLLQALHVLALSERQFCTPSDKPTKFVVYLAPYLKLGGHASANAGEQHTRAEADQLICVLAILGAIIPGLRSLPTRLVGELEADLMALVRGHAFRTVRNTLTGATRHLRGCQKSHHSLASGAGSGCCL